MNTLFKQFVVAILAINLYPQNELLAHKEIQDIVKTVKMKRIQFKDLANDEKQLFEKALQVRNNAQAPYSNYYVGVAILSNKNTVHVGCNVERCTWTQSTHAEQNAVDNMIAMMGTAKVEKVAVIAAPKNANVSLMEKSDNISSIACGHCLQIIWENSFQDPHVKIMVHEGNGIVACYNIEDLLPFRFGPENLNVFYGIEN